MTMFWTIHVKEKWVKTDNVLACSLFFFFFFSFFEIKDRIVLAYSVIIKILIIKEKMTLMNIQIILLSCIFMSSYNLVLEIK